MTINITVDGVKESIFEHGNHSLRIIVGNGNKTGYLFHREREHDMKALEFSDEQLDYILNSWKPSREVIEYCLSLDIAEPISIMERHPDEFVNSPVPNNYYIDENNCLMPKT